MATTQELIDELNYFDFKTKLQVILTQLASGQLSADDLSAIVGANNPSSTNKFVTFNDLNAVSGLPIFADNAAALTGGLTANRLYKTSAGDLRIVV